MRVLLIVASLVAASGSLRRPCVHAVNPERQALQPKALFWVVLKMGSLLGPFVSGCRTIKRDLDLENYPFALSEECPQGGPAASFCLLRHLLQGNPEHVRAAWRNNTEA